MTIPTRAATLDLQADNKRLRVAADAARQAIQYSIDMGGTDPGGVLLQALNKCTAALGHQQGPAADVGKHGYFQLIVVAAGK